MVKKFTAENVKKIAIHSLIMVVGLMIAFFCGYTKGAFDTGVKLQNKIEEVQRAAQETIASITSEVENKTVELANAMSKIKLQEDVIKEYKLKEEVEATIQDIRDVNIEIFKEADVKISYSDQVPMAILSTKNMIDPEKFGYLSDIQETIKVRYYFGSVAARISIVNEKNTVQIKYDRNAFVDPYKIIAKDTKLNTGAKILTNYGSDKTAELVNDVGFSLLSKIEDTYVERLKEEYANSSVPVYINGTKIEDWNESNKIFVALRPVDDNVYELD